MRKGSKHSEESRKRLSLSHLGNTSHLGFKHSDSAREKMSRAHLGRRHLPHSEATRRKLSEALRGHPQLVGRTPWNKGKTGVYSPDTRRRISIGHKGKVLSSTTRRRISAGLSGPKSHLWRGGITKDNHKIRDTVEMKLWREAVFQRDDWTCQICGKRGGQIEADHIKQFAYYPELRLDVNNGRTLCRTCHLKTETFGRKQAI
jgi:5-methylcytosine-specific restriction endonuclease McrA